MLGVCYEPDGESGDSNLDLRPEWLRVKGVDEKTEGQHSVQRDEPDGESGDSNLDLRPEWLRVEGADKKAEGQHSVQQDAIEPAPRGPQERSKTCKESEQSSSRESEAKDMKTMAEHRSTFLNANLLKSHMKPVKYRQVLAMSEDAELCEKGTSLDVQEKMRCRPIKVPDDPSDLAASLRNHATYWPTAKFSGKRNRVPRAAASAAVGSAILAGEKLETELQVRSISTEDISVQAENYEEGSKPGCSSELHGESDMHTIANAVSQEMDRVTGMSHPPGETDQQTTAALCAENELTLSKDTGNKKNVTKKTLKFETYVLNNLILPSAKPDSKPGCSSELHGESDMQSNANALSQQTERFPGMSHSQGKIDGQKTAALGAERELTWSKETMKKAKKVTLILETSFINNRVLPSEMQEGECQYKLQKFADSNRGQGDVALENTEMLQCPSERVFKLIEEIKFLSEDVSAGVVENEEMLPKKQETVSSVMKDGNSRSDRADKSSKLGSSEKKPIKYKHMKKDDGKVMPPTSAVYELPMSSESRIRIMKSMPRLREHFLFNVIQRSPLRAVQFRLVLMMSNNVRLRMLGAALDSRERLRLASIKGKEDECKVATRRRKVISDQRKPLKKPLPKEYTENSQTGICGRIRQACEGKRDAVQKTENSSEKREKTTLWKRIKKSFSCKGRSKAGESSKSDVINKEQEVYLASTESASSDIEVDLAPVENDCKEQVDNGLKPSNKSTSKWKRFKNTFICCFPIKGKSGSKKARISGENHL